MIEGMPSHEYAVHVRIGKRQFACSACDFKCYSHKWVDEHIEEMRKHEECPAPGGYFGEYLHPDIAESCEVCRKKRECEIEKLNHDLTIMKAQGEMFLKDPSRRPLQGIGKYADLYDEKQTRLQELMEMR